MKGDSCKYCKVPVSVNHKPTGSELGCSAVQFKENIFVVSVLIYMYQE